MIQYSRVWDCWKNVCQWSIDAERILVFVGLDSGQWCFSKAVLDFNIQWHDMAGAVLPSYAFSGFSSSFILEIKNEQFCYAQVLLDVLTYESLSLLIQPHVWEMQGVPLKHTILQVCLKQLHLKSHHLETKKKDGFSCPQGRIVQAKHGDQKKTKEESSREGGKKIENNEREQKWKELSIKDSLTRKERFFWFILLKLLLERSFPLNYGLARCWKGN